ncbi:MAG: primosomal protein N' [Candidatus Aquicultor secundus]|uniref:Replication restart protein PriA n=1 Tax=Candidatus Aquicultor secundus TaxID=1973895 RepID=A0A2M7T9W1_9ACTN|nr:primosomal protein N' [Candidatus Aquicultor secundus]NCO65231.1 primosomal protein N' [Solirubrobacter sp.]OIO86384.1 MAG: primosomal protein N' [Candidatus Aquicultor secundus]PIU26816.1 MAG: primosomal protein N' [Candidatus Aquicultor secundus]PIX52451.1 MAG: primosomal protein N' [Candidatus Aquicultor secundus]PIY41109.1 MAG: primosomal protein N' [Candidatus Aquicultor secundus]
MSVITEVIVDLPVREVDRIFDYLVPPVLASKISVGSVVLIPFGRTRQIGYVVGFTDTSEAKKLVSIEAVLNERPVFDERMVDVCRWIAKHYLSTLGEALKLAIPPGRGSKIIQLIRIAGAAPVNVTPRQSEIIDALKDLGGEAPIEALKSATGGKDISSVVSKLQALGLVERIYEIEQPKVKEYTARYAVLVAQSNDRAESATAEFKRAPKQRQIYEALVMCGSRQVAKLLADSQAPHSSLQALVERGLVRIEERVVNREPEQYFFHKDTTFELTDEQEGALSAILPAIDKGSSDVFLLQGVTGSGKTEVYLRAIQRVLEQGKGAIVLVPEIALTAQVVARFKARFGENVAILHSGLGGGERFDQWRGIQEGRYRVVVGARSAVFAPISNLGVIVVDEEHEASYKQGRNPRYNARDVAIKRAEVEGACAILGSATPSLESKWRSENDIYRPLFLRRRIQKRQLPRIEIVDMRDEPFQKIRPIFSGLLVNRLNATLGAGGKAILFLNRRGFSNFIICQDCGFVPKCRNCSVSLTYHSVNHSLRCHHCNFATRAPDTCPKCGGSEINYPGVGTQRVEGELDRLYPGVPVIRMDADTTSRKGAHQKRLAMFQNEKSAILLGTQMIAKGLDFPEVTLVGVINADTSIHLPDFRAAEHTFQLLMQVAGRAGRGEQPGRVVIQTHTPESYPLQAVLTAGYDEFYQTEIEFRRELNYPPFSTIVRMLFSGAEPEPVVGLAKRAAKIIAAAGLDEAADIVGPSPAPLLKVKGDYRWHILLKVRDDLTIKSFLEDNFRRFVPEKYQNVVILSIDVDPVWVL